MKKLLSILVCIFHILTLFNTVVFATEDNSDDFWQQVSVMVSKYEEDTYFSTMSVTIGESEIDIDGEIVLLGTCLFLHILVDIKNENMV